jgi:hypothetical protein
MTTLKRIAGRHTDRSAGKLWRLAELLDRLESVDLDCSPDAAVRVLTGSPSLFEKEPPSTQELRSASAEVRKLLRRKPTLRPAGRPRGSFRPAQPIPVTEETLAVYIKARATRSFIRAYPDVARKEILDFIGHAKTNDRCVDEFLAAGDHHVVRFLLKRRLAIGDERAVRELLRRLRHALAMLPHSFPLITRERQFWNDFGLDEPALKRLRQLADRRHEI